MSFNYRDPNPRMINTRSTQESEGSPRANEEQPLNSPSMGRRAPPVFSSILHVTVPLCSLGPVVAPTAMRLVGWSFPLFMAAVLSLGALVSTLVTQSLYNAHKLRVLKSPCDVVEALTLMGWSRPLTAIVHVAHTCLVNAATCIVISACISLESWAHHDFFMGGALALGAIVPLYSRQCVLYVSSACTLVILVSLIMIPLSQTTPHSVGERVGVRWSNVSEALCLIAFAFEVNPRQYVAAEEEFSTASGFPFVSTAAHGLAFTVNAILCVIAYGVFGEGIVTPVTRNMDPGVWMDAVKTIVAVNAALWYGTRLAAAWDLVEEEADIALDGAVPKLRSWKRIGLYWAVVRAPLVAAPMVLPMMVPHRQDLFLVAGGSALVVNGAIPMVVCGCLLWPRINIVVKGLLCVVPVVILGVCLCVIVTNRQTIP